MTQTDTNRLAAPRDHRNVVHKTLAATRRLWWIVALSGLVGALAGLGYTLVQTPEYRSTATLYVTIGPEATAQAAYQGSLASQQRVVSYIELLGSEIVIADALERAGMDLPVSSVRQATTGAAKPGTVLMTVSVDDQNPDTATALTNALSESLAEYVATIEKPTGSEEPLANLTLVSPASVPTDPVRPVAERNILGGLILGLLVGVGIAFIRVRLDQTVHNENDLAEIEGLSLLGSIPRSAQARDNRGRETGTGTGGLAESGLVDFAAGSTPVAESYRKLRTNLSFANVDDNVKSVLVTSANPGDGKTTTAINLSLVIAEAGYRVLLIDADLRRPSVASRLGIGSGVGFTDVLRGEAELADVVQTPPNTGLDVVVAGALPPNPAELLGSRRAREFFATVGENYDHVVIDSPPVVAVTDAVVISQSVDGVLMVVRADGTRTPDLRSALDQVRAGARVLGSVLNGMVMNRSRAYGYYGSEEVTTTARTTVVPPSSVGPRAERQPDSREERTPVGHGASGTVEPRVSR